MKEREIREKIWIKCEGRSAIQNIHESRLFLPLTEVSVQKPPTNHNHMLCIFFSRTGVNFFIAPKLKFIKFNMKKKTSRRIENGMHQLNLDSLISFCCQKKLFKPFYSACFQPWNWLRFWKLTFFQLKRKQKKKNKNVVERRIYLTNCDFCQHFWCFSLRLASIPISITSEKEIYYLFARMSPIKCDCGYEL